MPKTRKQKEEAVVKLTDKLSKAKSVVFANYQGMTMKQLSDLRAELRKQGAEFSVTKNNLLKIALKDTNSELITHNSSLLEGPIATLFSFEDEISPLKALAKAFKDNQVGSVKAGIMEGEVFDEEQILKLASLPSKDELKAEVVGSLGAPLYGIVRVLQANLRNLVYTLDQIRVQKGGEV